jgi:hypothetical protein
MTPTMIIMLPSSPVLISATRVPEDRDVGWVAEGILIRTGRLSLDSIDGHLCAVTYGEAVA